MKHVEHYKHEHLYDTIPGQEEVGGVEDKPDVDYDDNRYVHREEANHQNPNELAMKSGQRFGPIPIPTPQTKPKTRTRKSRNQDEPLPPPPNNAEPLREELPRSQVACQGFPVEGKGLPLSSPQIVSKSVQINNVQHTSYYTINTPVYDMTCTKSDELFETDHFPEVLMETLLPLDLEDWKKFASHLNLGSFIESVEAKVKNHRESPTRLLLDKYWKLHGRNASITRIYFALKQIGRIDLVQDLEDAEREWVEERNEIIV